MPVADSPPTLRSLLLEALDHFEELRAKRCLRLFSVTGAPMLTADELLTELLVAMRAHLAFELAARHGTDPAPAPDHMTCVHGYTLGNDCEQCLSHARAMQAQQDSFMMQFGGEVVGPFKPTGGA
jgi:hypothetical protein